MRTIKQINAAIAGIRRSTSTVRDKVQALLVDIAEHAYAHGDVTAYDRLYEAAHGLNQRGVVNWVQEHGYAKFSTESGRFSVNKAMRKNVPFDREALNEAPKWYESGKTKRDPKAVDIAKRIESLAGQVEKGEKEFTVELQAIKEAYEHLRRVCVDRIDTELGKEFEGIKAA